MHADVLIIFIFALLKSLTCYCIDIKKIIWRFIYENKTVIK